MHSSTSSSDFVRPIPKVPWRGITVIVVLIVFAAAAAWEIYVRSIGYAPTLNDTEDLWVQARRRGQARIGRYRRRLARPCSISTSMSWKKDSANVRSNSLLPGSCAYPVLADLANDERFHGTIICSIVPGMFFAPGGPLVEDSEKALAPLSQADAGPTGQPSPGHVPRRAYRLSQTGRPHARRSFSSSCPFRIARTPRCHPRSRPILQTVDRERRARMIEQCAQPGRKLQSRIQQDLAAAFHTAAATDLCPQGSFHGEHGQGDRGSLSSIRPRRWRNFAPAAARSFSSASRLAANSRRSKTGSIPRARDWERLLKGHQRSRHLLRRLSGARQLHLSRVVASLRRRFRRVQQAPRPAPSHCASDVKSTCMRPAVIRCFLGNSNVIHRPPLLSSLGRSRRFRGAESRSSSWLTVFAAAAAWEIYVRSIGYGPTLNDTEDLWVQARRRVQPESVVIVGDSRPVFDLDLDELERGLGKRPVQLALPGSCAYPVFADLANDESFHGTIICSIVPGMFFAPGGPLLETSEKALGRYHKQTPAQRVSHHLGMFLEEHVAFLKQEDLTLDVLLKQLPIPNRPNAQVPPRFPPYFQTVDRERRARMIEQCAAPGSELARRIQQIWLPLFTPPPPPTYVPKEVFMAEHGQGDRRSFRRYDESRARNSRRAAARSFSFVFRITAN